MKSSFELVYRRYSMISTIKLEVYNRNREQPVFALHSWLVTNHRASVKYNALGITLSHLASTVKVCNNKYVEIVGQCDNSSPQNKS